MAKPVLIDTSVWIAYLRREENAFAKVNLLADAGQIRTLGLVLAELYQGCKSQKEVAVVHDLGEIFPKLDESPGIWEEAGLMVFKLRRQGFSVGLADCYIALIAARAGISIFSYDKHFEVLASACSIDIYY